MVRNATATNQQLTVSYYSYLLTKNNISPNVLDFDRRYTETWNLAKMWSPTSQGTNDDQGEYHRFYKPRVVNNATVSAAPTLVGSNLIVPLANGHDGFRKGDVVYDENMKMGRVIDLLPGQITIEPQFQPATLSASTDFQVGARVYVSHDRSGNKWSDAKSYLFTKKDQRTDYVEFQRDAGGRARRDKIKSFIGKTSGVAYTWTDDEKDMFDRMMKTYTKKIWLSEPGQKVSTYQGAINGTRGIRRSIKNDGAANYSSNAQITKAILEDMVMTVAEVNGGGYDKELTIIPGRRAHKKICEFYPDQLAFTGSRWAGQYQQINLDVRFIQIAGIKVNITPMSWLNDDQEVPDWFKDSIYIVDTSALPSANGMGAESPFQRIHWSEDPLQPESYICKAKTGLTSHASGNGTGGVMIDGYEVTQSSLDGYHFDMAMDNGLSYIADASGLFEFPH